MAPEGLNFSLITPPFSLHPSSFSPSPLITLQSSPSSPALPAMNLKTAMNHGGTKSIEEKTNRLGEKRFHPRGEPSWPDLSSVTLFSVPSVSLWFHFNSGS
jgi:hypothetical protein